MDLTRQRYQLDHPFVLYVGNIKPHKNIGRLVDAVCDRAAHQGPDDLKLIIIGDELSKYPVLRQSVHRHKLDKHVRFSRLPAAGDAGGVLPPGPRVRVPVALRRASACRRSKPWRAARRW